jgi:transposase-like protein
MSHTESIDERVADQPERRRFTPEYKLRILQEIDQRRGERKGVVGEILRREGLYASQVASWRSSLEEVIANGLPERKRGRKTDPALTYKKQAEKLERQLKRTQEDLRQARLIIEAQKKIAQMYTPDPLDPEGENE